LQQQDNEDENKQDDMYSCRSRTMRMIISRTTCTVAQLDNEDDKKQDDMYSCSSKTMRDAEPHVQLQQL